MTYAIRIRRIVGSLITLSAMSGAVSALAQNASPPPPTAAATPVVDVPGQWTFRFTPYGWLTFISGSQTTKGRTTDIDTNVFQLFSSSQSLIPWMSYFEARYQDRIGLFLDVMYANLTAGDSATKNFRLDPHVSGSLAASVGVNYETLTVQFGGAYEVTKVGPDRSAEGPGMAGVGQTAFDVLVGGRYWRQKADLSLNLVGTINVNVGDLDVSADRTRAFARSGYVSWVDPFIGFRLRHRLAPGQDLVAQADIGGFGIGSRISWQALAAYSFEFGKTGSVTWAGVIGYRALYVDYSQGSGNTLFELNELQQGPLFGLSARF